jgi:hypothetical protein
MYLIKKQKYKNNGNQNSNSFARNTNVKACIRFSIIEILQTAKSPY